MQDRLFANPKVDYIWNAGVAEYLGVDEPYRVLTGVRLRSTKDGSTRDLSLDGLFLAIGHSPNTAVFEGQLAMTPEGYLLTPTALAWRGRRRPRGTARPDAQLRHGHQRRGGLRRGDVVDTHYRQAITAAGSGCAAAIDCEKWLEATGAAH